MISFVCFSKIVEAKEPVSNQRLFDQANLLNNNQKQQITEQINYTKEQTKMDIVVVTTDDTQGKNYIAYADDFYDEGGFGTNKTKDGMLLLIDMQSRNYYISTTGEMTAFLSDSRIKSIINSAKNDMKKSDYTAAITNILNDVNKYVKKGIPKGYEYNADTGKVIRVPYLSPLKIIIALILGSAVAVSIYLVVSRRYQLKGSVYDYPFYDLGTVTLTSQQDIKTSDLVTTRHIPQNNNSGGGFGGGSSTHVGSSGTSHGGGGGSF
ncbi:TPM domain-containing protein [Vagococcus vulneris]|uniref:TPM domain-containing protein n=1 Tax=Vagococcus vulneris TaxID=1977869 RepID=UPI001402A6DE|nr:TPM domain-containing protein [Vagococcus vulneris]